jgi:Leucine-rich repeat (LRR) protein
MSKRPSRVVRLTVEDIVASASEENLEMIEEIEIIFGPVNEIDCLDGLSNLRSFTLVNCGLQRISNVSCVGHTLEKLCLMDQGLTRMENLLLPQLRELMLQQNGITRIENLEGCPKLQKLWLFDNKISKLENLHCLGDLRELWVQDNKISTLTGLENVSSLQILAVAANRLTDFKDLQKLSHLPNLRDLSLDDAHFGSCPIARSDGYWNFVLCYLKQIRRLDGIEIDAHDRSQAEDAYMAQVLRFNDRIAAIQRENQRELLAIETRQRRSASHADVMKQELLDAFQVPYFLRIWLRVSS